MKFGQESFRAFRKPISCYQKKELSSKKEDEKDEFPR